MMHSEVGNLRLEDLCSDLKACAYAVFAKLQVADEKKPKFLSEPQELRSDFKSYAIANENYLGSAIKTFKDHLENICIGYSVLKFMRDDLSKDVISDIKEILVFNYFQLLTEVKKTRGSGTTPVEGLFIVELVLPVFLTAVLELSAQEAGSSSLFKMGIYKYLQNLGMLSEITTANNLVDIFCSEYQNISIESVDDYLLWLYQSLYFIHILIGNIFSDLDAECLARLMLFIKKLSINLEDDRVFSISCLKMLQQCTARVLALDNKLLPKNKEIYFEVKPSLFSLVLDLLLPMHKFAELSELQRRVLHGCLGSISIGAFEKGGLPDKMLIDIYMGLFAIDGAEAPLAKQHFKSLSIECLATLATRLETELLSLIGYINSVKHLGFILEYGAGSIEDENDIRNFFIATKSSCVNLFKGAMTVIASQLYINTEECYTAVANHNIVSQQIVGNILDTYKFSSLIQTCGKYSELFPQARSILMDLYIINLIIMDDAGAWSRHAACDLLRGAVIIFDICKLKRSELDFAAVYRAADILLDKINTSGQIPIDDSSLSFWENIFDIFPSMHNSISEWSEDKRRKIDYLCSQIMQKMSFNEDNRNVVSEIKIGAVMVNLVSSDFMPYFYNNFNKILSLLNTHSDGSPSYLLYHMLLLRNWLISHVTKAKHASNDEVLDLIIVFPDAEDISPMSRLMYICQVSEILYLIISEQAYFSNKLAMHNKIAEIGSLILKERSKLYNVISDGVQITLNPYEIMMMNHVVSLLDKDFMSLLQRKIKDFSLPVEQEVPSKTRNKYEVLAINSLSFISNKFVLKCNDKAFAFDFDKKIPRFNILKAQVRYYKKEKVARFFSGIADDTLVSLFPYVESPSINKALKDEDLYKLFDDPVTKKATGSCSKKNAAKKTKKRGNAAKIESGVEKDIILPEKESSLEQKTIAERFEIAFEDLWSDKSSLSKTLDNIISLVAEGLGFRVNVTVIDDEVEFSLGERKLRLNKCKNFASSQHLWDAFTDLPASLLQEGGMGNITRVVLEATGRVAQLKFLAATTPAITVKDEDFLSAYECLRFVFLDDIQERLKVIANLDGSTLSLSMDVSVVECDLKEVSLEQLWPKLLYMHKSLLGQVYGGNIAFVKLEYDDNKFIAIDKSDALGRGHQLLQRIAVTDGNIGKFVSAFFTPLNPASFNFFKSLDPQMAEIIIKIIVNADTNVFIYGHPVIEHIYGRQLRDMGVLKQPVRQLFIMLNNYIMLDVRRILESSEPPFNLKGVKPHTLYYDYNGNKVAVCLDHSYMMNSIFQADHFYCMVAKDTFAYNAAVDTPASLDPIVIRNARPGRDIFTSNPYALKIALEWSKIVGRLGGSLRNILLNLGFISIVTANDLENVTWKRASSSKEFLPKAANYLEAVFHLQHDEANQVLAEIKEYYS